MTTTARREESSSAAEDAPQARALAEPRVHTGNRAAYTAATLPPPETTSLPLRRPATRPGGGGGGPGSPGGPRRPARKKPNYALRRTMALAILLVVLLLAWLLVRGAVALVGGLFGSDDKRPTPASAPQKAAATNVPTVAPDDSLPKVVRVTPSTTPAMGAAGPADKTTMVQKFRLASTAMAPKSIVAGPSGVLFAQNMMYKHSVSVFKPDGTMIKSISDSVDLSRFGIAGHPGTSKGAPVEVAFTPDGKYAWVSNYSMYGKGFGPEGLDSCRAGDGTDTSFVYRIDIGSLTIDKVVPVGAVPKYVAVTPDGKNVLVTNWCSWNLSVIDAAAAKETARIDLGGRYPRGVVASPDNRTAYVALMGSNKIVAVDLAAKTVTNFAEPGSGPRHIVESPDGKFLYVTNNSSGTVVKLDRATGAVVATTTVGSEPRSMTISSDGLAIYVVNYGEGSMTKIATSTMTAMQTVKTDASPIGITYEPTTKSVWVACYGGSLLAFDDAKLTA